MSASLTRIDLSSAAGGAFTASVATKTAPDPQLPLDQGNRVLDALAHQRTLPALLAFSSLHEQIHDPEVGKDAVRADLLQTERFVLDEVLQLLCDRAQAITAADGVVIALCEGPALICRAGSGPLALQRGVHLVPDSELLQESLDAGRIFCCDDCDVDTRLELDIARMLSARSTIIVPLKGGHAQLGVIQAFAEAPFAFPDEDIRTFDLFGELILSALKPREQDRRYNWLADVADAVLKTPDPAANPTVNQIPETKHAPVLAVEVMGSAAVQEPAATDDGVQQAEILDEPVESALTIDEVRLPTLAVEEPRFSRPLVPPLSIPASSRPGLTGVLALVAVAALFSAGVWWGMRASNAGAKSAAVSPAPPHLEPPAATTGAPDHLLDPVKQERDEASATPASAGQLAVLPKITSVRHWSSSVGSTVVIDMEDQVPYEVHRLTAPERIYFDLHDTALVPDLEGKNIDVSDPSLTRVRVAQPVAGVTRVVLDTRNGSNFSVSMEANPYRLIVELRDNAKAQALAPNRPLNSLARTEAPTALLPQTGTKVAEARGVIGHFRIVLDAGHGGWDLGTVGRDGLLEKDLVLDVAERLGNLLKNRLGAEVIFTRADDAYVPLDQRAEIANQSQADLFVSVHANYSSSVSARGIETYFTNTFSAPGSREADKHETGEATNPVPVALSASELHDKVEDSRQLAEVVQKSLYSTLAARNPGLRNRGVKDSRFVVLTGTTMPAILSEISFVSSPEDEHRLQSETYRQQIAEALYKGISQYEAGARHRVKVAQVERTTAQR